MPNLTVIQGGEPPIVDDTDSDDRPQVVIQSAKPHQAIDELSDLLHLDKNLFVRGKELVTIVTALAPDGEERAPVTESTPVICPIESATMTERLAKAVRIVRVKPLSKTQAQIVEMGGRPPPTEYVAATAPPLVVTGLLARRQWPLRHLVSVSETPILRPDGTIIQSPGYDRVTGYVYRPNCVFPEINPDATQTDARGALDELKEIFAEFPYANEASRMVPIAAILTLLARSAICGSVPAFLFDANTRGSGKTLQADAVSLVALGRSAARKSYPSDEEEMGKILTSYAVAGARCILFDNVTREFGGGELDQVITARDTVEVRVLGRSEVRLLPWNAVIMASGNNMVLSEDTVRRVLIARLESPDENPEERGGHTHHLPTWIPRERPRLVAAALTILRAYMRLGLHRDGTGKAWGSFEEWSRLVPGTITFAGGADPMLARPSTEQHVSDQTRALRTMVAMLPMLDKDGHGLTCREIITRLYPEKADPAFRKLDGFDDLRDAIEAWTHAKGGQVPSLQLLGKRMQTAVGRVVGGRSIHRAEEGGYKAVRWVVR